MNPPPSQQFVFFKGTHYEMGLRQGRAYKSMLKKALGIIQNHEGFHSIKPRWMPMGLFMHLAGWAAMGFNPLGGLGGVKTEWLKEKLKILL